jgi:peptidyl-prolyl cis-trans isomerase D
MIKFLQNPTKTRRFFLGAILAALIVAMVAYLGNAFTGDSAAVTGVYATVAGEPVSAQEVSQRAQQLARQQFQGRQVPDFLMPYLQKRAADQLVMQAALVAEANRMGLKVTDEELRDELRSGGLGQQLFPKGNYIGDEAYRDFVANTYQLDIPHFEKLVKQSLMMRKLESVVEGSVTVPEAEIQKEFQKQKVKVKFDYAVLSTEDLAKQVPVNDTELHAYYDKNKSRYENSIAEQRKVRYVLVDASKVPVQLTEKDYSDYYTAHQDDFKEPEQADVRHILVKTEQEAKDIKKQLDAGAKFEDLAKKYSQDPGSKDNGGLYKDVTRGKMVPEFDKATFSLPIGKVSDPVKTDFGYHIIRVDARRDARVKPLAEVKPQIEQTLKAQKGAKDAESLANAVLTEARTQSLDQAAAKNNLNIVTTDFFNQSASLPGIGNSPQFMQAVFTGPAKSPAQLVTVPQGYAIVEVTADKPAATPTFEQARKQVEEQFRNERASSMLQKKTEELADKARSMKDLKKAAKEEGATFKTSELVDPSGQVPDLGPMSGPATVAFDMQPGQISGPLAVQNKGVVIALVDKQQPTAADYDKQKEQVREQLLNEKRGEVMNLFAEKLQERMQKNGQIKVNTEEAKRLFGSAGAAG